MPNTLDPGAQRTLNMFIESDPTDWASSNNRVAAKMARYLRTQHVPDHVIYNAILAALEKPVGGIGT